MKRNPYPRTRGTKLLEPKDDSAKVESIITTRKFDIELYNQTGELKYLDEEGTTMPNIDQIANGKRMREEITTLEQFEAIGNTKEVAQKYEVSVGTAHGIKMSLKAKEAREKADKILEAQKVSSTENNEPLHTQELKDEFKEIMGKCEKAITEDFGTVVTINANSDDKGECRPGNLRESCAQANHKGDRVEVEVGDEESCYLIDGDTNEPEEDIESVITNLEESWKKPEKDIDELWKSIAADIRNLHKMHINRAENEFQERLAGVIEEC